MTWSRPIFEALAPGAYTAIVAGKEDLTGVGLVEVYRLPGQTSHPQGSRRYRQCRDHS